MRRPDFKAIAISASVLGLVSGPPVAVPALVLAAASATAFAGAHAATLDITDLSNGEAVPPDIRNALKIEAFDDPVLRAIFREASEAFRAGDHARAAERGRRLTELTPDSPQGWHILGLALINLGDERAALDALSEAAGRYDRNADPLVLIGDILRNRGDLEGAREAYADAFARNPQDWRPAEGLGAVAVERGDPTAALAHYSEAGALAPRNLDLRLQIARLQVAEGDMDGARAGLETFVAANPDAVGGRIALGRLAFLTGDPGTASAQFDAAIALDAADPRWRILKARAQRDAGELDAAQATLSQAHAAFPDASDVTFELASLHGLRRSYPEAVALFERGVARWPAIAKFHAGLARAAYRIGDHAKALAPAAHLAALPNATSAEHLQHALVLERLGREADAIAAYDAALAVDGDNWIAANNLANLLFAAAPARALALARGAAARAPDNLSVRRTSAWATYMAGDVEAARAAYAALEADEADDPVQLFRHAVVLQDAGEAGAARGKLEAALALSDTFDGVEEARRRLMD